MRVCTEGREQGQGSRPGNEGRNEGREREQGMWVRYEGREQGQRSRAALNTHY